MERWTSIVVDKYFDSSSDLYEALGALECELVPASSPERIDAALEANKTALLLIANPAPDLDLKRVCERAHAAGERSHYVVLALEQRSPGAVAAAFDLGVDEVLTKPFVAAELQARFEHARRFLSLETLRRSVDAEGGWLAEIATTRSLHSRRYLKSQLDNEAVRSTRFAHSLAMILIGVHHNDERVVRGFGHMLTAQLRSPIDWTARYAQQRVAVVLPETDLGGALRVAERVRSRLSDDSVLRAAGLPMKFSMNAGVSAFNRGSFIDTQLLCDAAEGYLGDAIRKGTNQIAGGPALRPS